MGFLKNIVLGGIGLKTYQNIYNKPIVAAPDGYVITGMKQKGFGSTWDIKYSKCDQMNITRQFKVSGSTRSVTIGRDIFNIHWP